MFQLAKDLAISLEYPFKDVNSDRGDEQLSPVFEITNNLLSHKMTIDKVTEYNAWIKEE